MLSFNSKESEPRRSNKGSVAALLPCGILICVVGIGAFALDISHNVTVRSELQNATDAGALAGAQDLIDTKTERNADTTALTVTEANSADGNPVSNATTGTEVMTQTQWDNSTNSGTVQVDGTVTINNIFSKIFGHSSDAIRTQSTAQAWRSVTAIKPNQAFPLMVSLDTAQGNPRPLYQMNIGDKFDIHINSQQYKNAAWTGLNTKNTNANWLTDSIDQLFGFKPIQNGHITGAQTGDSLELGNGVLAQKQLADGAYESRLTDEKMVLVIPVMKGEPPYNQARECVGFITVHIDRVTKNKSGGEVLSLHATIVKHVVKGTGGIPDAGNANEDAGMKTISAGTVQLIH
jgi:Flp pilus assembly protein TadG